MLVDQQGYIIGRQVRDVNGRLELSYWVKTDHGTVQVIPEKQELIFFADLSASHLLESHDIHYVCHGFRSFSDTELLTVYCTSLSQLKSVVDLLKQHQVALYEEDIKATERYLMERQIRGATEFVGYTSGTQDRVTRAKMKPSHYQPHWSIWSLDIETSVSTNRLLSIGVVSDALEVVFIVSEQTIDDSRCQFFADEKSLLLAFMRFVRLHNPDLIIGWNVIGFDLAFIDRRCQALGIAPNFGINGEPWKLRSATNSGRYFIDVPGRAVLDGISLLKVGGYHFESYSLNNVSQEILQDSKLLHGNDRWQDIERMHASDLSNFVAYNLQDCHLVLRIFKRLKLVELQQTRVDLTGIPLDQMGGSVAAFENLYLPLLHRKQFVAPAWSTDDFVASPGGFVMSSKPGFFENVLVFDFKSLYPSIIRTFNIDPLARIYHEGEQVSGFLGAEFAREMSILPSLIGDLAKAREQAKADKNSILSYAIKIIMNSFYGVLGSNVCRFYHAQLASSITMRGHQILEQTRQWIEAAGGEVIYGDTDSVFVLLSGEAKSAEDIEKQGNALCERMNQLWQAWCHDTLGVTSFLELEFETRYEHFFMPTIRGQEEGSKKRYAGKVDGQLVFKGLEAARSDWTPFAKRLQRTLFEKIFNKEDPIEFIKETVEQLKRGCFDEELVYSKRLSRPLDQYIKTVPPHVRAAKLREEANKAEGRQPEFNQAGKRIQYFYQINGVAFFESKTDLVHIDYEHYLEKQMEPIVDSLLIHFNTSLHHILNKQMTLI